MNHWAWSQILSAKVKYLWLVELFRKQRWGIRCLPVSFIVAVWNQEREKQSIKSRASCWGWILEITWEEIIVCQIIMNKACILGWILNIKFNPEKIEDSYIEWWNKERKTHTHKEFGQSSKYHNHESLVGHNFVLRHWIIY